MATNPYLQLIPRPAAGSINTGLSALRVGTQRQYLGMPRAAYNSECRPVTDPALRARMLTADVGPFRVTGFDWAVWALQRIMADVLAADQVLYAGLGSAGMLCARLVRGSSSTPSNHSWGLALDLTVFGVLDTRGDNQTLSALMDLYPHFRRHGWYWGAAYPTEDSMHWEPAQETFVGWMTGTIPAPTPLDVVAVEDAIAAGAATRPGLQVGELRIEGEIEEGALLVPARPACTALGLPCDFVAPRFLQIGARRLAGVMRDGRLYVPARDLCVYAWAADAWDGDTKTLIATLPDPGAGR